MGQLHFECGGHYHPCVADREKKKNFIISTLSVGHLKSLDHIQGRETTRVLRINVSLHLFEHLNISPNQIVDRCRSLP